MTQRNLTVKTLIRRSEYHDSVTLMLAARELSGHPGVRDAAVVMATEANKAILRESGLLAPEAQSAGPNDLLVAISAEGGAAESALAAVDGLLQRKPETGGAAEYRPATLRSALKALPAGNVAVISVAGRYAAGEAWEALSRGLHVLLFSDNVSESDEVALKDYACGHGLLLMGPGAGTAVLNGVALGFADALPRGPVGIVSAAGTGLQEVSTLLARQGVGVAQGIGTGGRDLKEWCGGRMMLQGLAALQADPSTAVIVLISKPPAPPVAQRVLAAVAQGAKPTVVCFLGGDVERLRGAANVIPARTLEEAALLAAHAAGAALAADFAPAEPQRAADLRAALAPGQRYLRALFSGGTLCYEAQVIWRERLGARVLSNAPLDEGDRLPVSARSAGHAAVDLGEEEFTVGRPHPMIDNDLRVRRLLQEARDPEAALIMLDVVLGYGAHPDPAAELGPAVREARSLARASGRELIVVASVTGTEQDPQVRSRQVKALEAAGAIVCASNAAAARLVAAILGERGGGAPPVEPAGSVHPRDTRDARGAVDTVNAPLAGFFERGVAVINVGLASMADSVREQGVPVVDVDWRPPLQGAARLVLTPEGALIDAINEEVCRRILGGGALLRGMGIARDVIPGMHARMILHAGPPVNWERMCGPQRGAVMGALIYEGLAADEREAERLAASGEIEFSPCHHHHAVGPMAGVVSPRMPVFVLENPAFGNRAYCTQNEGLGKVLRYGGMGPEVYARLKWMETDLYPALDRALQSLPAGIDVKALIAQALHMGDECHNRNRAATSLFLRAIGPALARTNRDNEVLARVIEFIDRNDHFFLNLSMPAGKAMLEPAEGVPGSTVVTVMARNGTDFGIQVSSMPGRWFTAPAGKVQGLYFAGFTEDDANPDIGDSTITETAGYGGFAMAAAPAITKFVGGTPQMALDATREMYEITACEHTGLTIPALDFRGTPLGIDVRRVVETGILPRLNTGIAHRQPGVGMVGAGVLRAPEIAFVEAYEAVTRSNSQRKDSPE